MKRLNLAILSVVLVILASACNKPKTLPPAIVGPFSAPVPVATPTPACGFTVLPSLPCGALTQQVTVIRDAATWNALVGPTSCAGSKAVPIPDFSVQMILVYALVEGATDPRTSGSFTSACLLSNQLEVNLQVNYSSTIMAPMQLGPCFCGNLAIAVPQTNLPINLTVCTTTTAFYVPPSTSCATAVY